MSPDNKKSSVTARKASRDGRTVWKDTRGNGFCVGVRFPMPHKIQPLKLKVMKATMNPTKMEARIKQKLRTLIGNVTHMQNVADQTLELIKSILTEDERNDSDTCRVVENLSCVCEEALQVLCACLFLDASFFSNRRFLYASFGIFRKFGFADYKTFSIFYS